MVDRKANARSTALLAAWAAPEMPNARSDMARERPVPVQLAYDPPLGTCDE